MCRVLHFVNECYVLSATFCKRVLYVLYTVVRMFHLMLQCKYGVYMYAVIAVYMK